MVSKKKHFKEVPAKFDFIANEKEILDWWHKSGVVKKYLNKNRNAKKRFSFVDGPITANNPMGVHHAWGRTLKDLYQRYKNMQGFKQRFQNGFDCQGLWVEVEVEKEKGFKTKKDIENYGIGKFVEDCKTRVRKYSKIQTEQSKRLGYFMDWGHSYYTMSEENNYMIWYFLKKCHQEGNLYKGKDAVPWCPRCGTSISQHEIVTEGYKQLTHDSVYMRFPVIKTRNQKPETNEFLLVWTTTPWTIPADTILAVNPEIEYAQVEFEGKKYWLAKSLIKDVFNQELKPIKIVDGQDLIEKENVRYYQAPFDDLPIIKKVAENGSNHFHRIVLSKNLVNEQEGTGIVHIVPGAGTEDHQLVKNELGWKDVIFPVVDETGAYVKNYGFLTGKNAKNNPRLIIDYLKEKNGGRYFFKVKSYTHSYPVCWRCGTELIWRLVDEWYIAMDNKKSKIKNQKSKRLSLRERMIRVAKKIRWLPEFGLKRELDWLKNMHDWMISKKRYWGLALPIWECQCGHFEVIGSKEELKEKALEACPPKLKERRRGWQEFEGHTPHRPWIDKVKIKCPKCGRLMTRVPDVGNPWLDAGIVNFSTLVDPKTGQVSYLTNKKYWREWYPADFITECFPGQFRNWFYSLIAMSTVFENHEPSKTVLGYALVGDEKGEEMHKSKGNSVQFDEAVEKMGADTMRWLYARQKPEFNLNFGYNIADEVRRQYLFLFWNSYRFFVTYANLNGFQPIRKSKVKSQKSKLEVKSQNVLDRWILSRLESTKKIAIEKLDNYHHHEAVWAIEKFLEDLSTWYIRRSRGRKSCLPTLHYVLKNLCLILAPFIPFLTETIWQEITNSKNSVHLQNWPKVNKKLINKKLEKQMAAVREVVSLGHAIRKEKQIKVRQPLRKFSIFNFQFSNVDPELAKLIRQELNVKEVGVKTGTGELKVELDTKITPELAAEGKARELIRQIQILRRKARLNLTDKITIFAPSWPKKWEKEILTRTNAVAIKEGQELKIIKT